MEQTLNISSAQHQYDTQIHQELSRGDWEGLHRSALAWLQAEPEQPIATFIKNIACLFINPPDIIGNKRYIETVGNKDWKTVLSWFPGFQSTSDQHNPYFQAIDFILRPSSKKPEAIEKALLENPNNAELLFLQAISLRDHNISIEKLKQAAANKPEFPACLYLLGIYSLELNKVEAAEAYLKQAVAQAPDFLEANYQLASLYTLYLPESAEQAKTLFQRVIELDPEGGAGKDARKVLDSQAQPQYGQRIGGGAGRWGGGMSILTILGISLLTVVLFSGPIANLFNINTPLIGILAGMFVFLGLYSAFNRRK